MRLAAADRVLLPLAVLIPTFPAFFGFVSVARNRILSGRPVSLWVVASGAPLWLCLAAGVVLMAGVLAQRSLWAVLGAASLMLGLLWMAGDHAALTAESLPAARVSFGAGFWLMQGACLLCVTEAARRMGAGGALLAVGLILGGIAALVALGRLDALSLLREYDNKRDIIGPAFLRHVGIVAASLVPTLAIGVPLGVACHRAPRLASSVFPALGLVQTIPSIALFGLLMAPLSALAVWFPALSRAGISGIGVAPAVIALVLYSLLPITRNTAAGLDGVPAPVRDAARGLGMTPAQIFWRVDVHLAFPAFLAGLRVTLVQAVGLAAVAALIGAGGLGAIMFDGLFTGALDLVLVGALPVIGLAVAVDLLLRAAVREKMA